jgi:xanthine dehydrogenase accessory factor
VYPVALIESGKTCSSRLSWIGDLQRLLPDQPCVLVTLNLVSGSAPRDSGSRMIVTANEVVGSIGGGNLEYKATELARDLLESKSSGHQEKEIYGLGPALNQCCGGAVALLYEVFDGAVPSWLKQLQQFIEGGNPVVLASSVDISESCKRVIARKRGQGQPAPAEVTEVALTLLQARGSEPMVTVGPIGPLDETWWLEPLREQRKPVVLFGAGHVGQAVVRALEPLPFSVSWADSRPAVFPDDLPGHIRALNTDSPLDLVAEAPAGCIFIVMTHSHQLDEDICFKVLQRDDFAWLGLIGSDTKRRRFVHRLEQRGIEPCRLDSLVCPIGLAGIRGKQPATIALSLAAQLMTNHED